MDNFEDIDLGEIFDGDFSIVAEELDFSGKEELNEDSTQTTFPILPVRNMVMFPQVVIPITAGREQSKSLLENAQETGRL
ncbi:hypothetical protein BPO_1630 [Bergeyella porcorum]|uniref:Lon N-terminal domain-containing protein n=1 Tax=Bergeyella porcorum TaxID=1735111 RepID=A0AAU0F278_9FLAO